MEKFTGNKEIATAIGFAGSARALARAIDESPRTVLYQIKRGFFAYELARKTAVCFELDLEALQQKPANDTTSPAAVNG